MSAGWLVYALVTGALISVAAAALEAVMRAWRWPARWIWAVAMTATLFIVAGAARPSADQASRVLVGVTVAATNVHAPSAGSAMGIVIDRISGFTATTMLAGLTTVSRWLPAWVSSIAAVMWAVAAAAGLAALTMVHVRLRRARKTWPSTELHGRRVRVAPSVGPAVIGIVRPEIVVPQWLLERAADEQRLVLAHEEEHVRARDHVLLGGACLAVALIPWHPAAWWMLARLRLALELDCDARVLRRGAPARRYGEMLIDLAGQCSGFRVGATALADKTTHLERRLLAMRPTTKRFTLVRAVALCAMTAISLAAACESRVPTSAEIQSMDVTSAKLAAEKAGLLSDLHGTSPVFYVNDVKVTAAEAHALPANDIATVNVQKGKSENDPSTIRIATVTTSVNGMKYRSAEPGAGSQESSALAMMKGVHETLSPSSKTFEGIVIIDGARADASALQRLDPKAITSVEILKGVAASGYSTDPAAKNGIIKVTTNGQRTKG